MQLPDESLEFRYTGALAPLPEAWTPLAELQAQHLLAPARLRGIVPLAMQVRSQVVAERELQQPPPELKPLEPGFIDLPLRLLESHRRKGESSDLGRILALAARLREGVDRVIVLGAGPATLPARALFTALTNRFHNELPHRTRLGVPRVYFAGDSFDNDGTAELLDVLENSCVDPELQEERWGLIAISKDGTALESAVAYRLFRRELVKYYGIHHERSRKLSIPVTGKSSRLRELARAEGIAEEDIPPIPDTVGERYAAFSAAGLLPAAVFGLDIRALLLGAAAMTRRFLEEPFDRNPVLQYAAVHHLLAEELGQTTRALAVWSDKLEGVGRWYENLLAGSLGKMSQGPSPLTLLGRDWGGRGQQFQEGTRTTVVTHLTVKGSKSPPLIVSMADHNEDDLNGLNRKSLADMNAAARAGVDTGLAEGARPSMELQLPAINEHSLGQLLQLLMLATVIEGRLLGVNPYSQPGVERAGRHGRKVMG